MEKITNDHPLSKSEDILQTNIDTLKKLFPTIVKEGKIDIKELEALLSDELETNEEYYRFTWAGKSDARREANKPSTATLRPCKEESKNWDTTENIFIEGENLEVLKLLQKSYANKIKMIYIDPPYNTGKDFVYKDNYADNLGNYLAITGQVDEEGKRTSTNSETAGRYHSNWLNMMYPRLKLARNLMKEDGVIFISIDDNEISNLRKICDEIFGEENFKGLVSRVTGTPTGGGNKAIVNEVDFIIIYTKTDKGLIEGAPLTEIEQKIYDRKDEKGTYLIRSLRRTGGEDRREDRPSMYYPMIAPDGTEVFPMGPTGYESRWICGKDKYNELKSQDLIEWQKTEKEGKTSWQVYQKYYLEGRLKQPSNLWKNIEGNKKATREVKKLFDDIKVFDFPKPVELIKYILMLSTEQDSLVLDFFAGSGTTAHSIFKLNSEDGGKRNFICVQLPEIINSDSQAYEQGYKMISDITKERIRRAGEKVKTETKEDLFKETGNSLDIGFKSFKLDTSNINAWDGNVKDFEKDLLNSQTNIKIDRTEEDVLFEVLLKYGLNLTVPIEEKTVDKCKIYNVGQGALFVCLAEKNITIKVAESIGKWKEELNPTSCRVLFRDNGFADDVAKTNSVQLLKRFGIQEINSI